MKAPTRDPGDRGVAHGTEAALELPEKAKSPRTPKRFRHMICFALFEVGFIDGIGTDSALKSAVYSASRGAVKVIARTNREL